MSGGICQGGMSGSRGWEDLSLHRPCVTNFAVHVVYPVHIGSRKGRVTPVATGVWYIQLALLDVTAQCICYA